MPWPKSKEPLFCRTCAKPIRKYTTTVYIRKEQGQYDRVTGHQRYAYVGDDWPKDIAACRRLSNQSVVAVKRSMKGEIASFSEWDGETYHDELFCGVNCAASFGRMAAYHTAMQTKAYAEAQARRQKKEAA